MKRLLLWVIGASYLLIVAHACAQKGSELRIGIGAERTLIIATGSSGQKPTAIPRLQ